MRNKWKCFLGIFFAVTQVRNKGVIVRVFGVCSDGLFPDPNMDFFYWKTDSSKSCFLIWTYSTLDDGDNEDQADPYWEKDQMVQQFNDHYKNNFEHG